MFAFLWSYLRQCSGRLARSVAACPTVLALLLAFACPASAEDEPDTPSAQAATPEAAAREIWSGAETVGSTWAFYTGITAAWGDVTQPGPRLRLIAGMSTYAYTYSFEGVQGRARAAQPFADLLAGYQWQVGAFTLKAFAGGTGHADIRTTDQALDLWGQRRIGAKLVGEAWWTIDPASWASLDAAFASPNATVWSRMRYGHRILPQLSLGPEALLSGEVSRLSGRLGAFARFDWPTGEIAVSGGFANAADTTAFGLAPSVKLRSATPYAALLWLQRF